jgi:carbamoyltransferase
VNNSSRYVLGISAFYHDSAVTLLRNGEICFAAQEERFTRIKHDSTFPINAIRSALTFANIDMSKIECVSYYEDPDLKSNRVVQTAKNLFPKGSDAFSQVLTSGFRSKKLLSKHIRDVLKYNGEIYFGNHHLSHAASAFFPSSFRSSAILTMDGVGEWATSTISVGKDNKISLLKEQSFPHSLGLLYSSFTKYCGFKVNSGEYKLMGLAPYGEPKYLDLIRSEIVNVHEDGSLTLNMNYFDFPLGKRMFNEKFEELFGMKTADPSQSTDTFYMDIAASIQKLTEEVVLNAAKFAKELTGEENLCLAGGVALNCVANGKIIDAGIFKSIWIQPAAGDAGGSLGSALDYWHQQLGMERKIDELTCDKQFGSYLGTEYSNDDIEKILQQSGAVYHKIDDIKLAENIADLISSGFVIGWFQGRMEFGPRALGARSILGDARNSEMQTNMNLKIKFRESFRPFAPSVLKSEISNWFKIPNDSQNIYESPYMLQVAQIHESKKIENKNTHAQGLSKLKLIRSSVPAITHIDFSARLQSVDGKYNKRYFDVLTAFHKKTGVPLIVNTSFNVRGEPIVESPNDAYKCFMRTGIDFLCIGNFLLDKNEQPKIPIDLEWKKEYELD